MGHENCLALRRIFWFVISKLSTGILSVLCFTPVIIMVTFLSSLALTLPPINGCGIIDIYIIWNQENKGEIKSNSNVK